MITALNVHQRGAISFALRIAADRYRSAAISEGRSGNPQRQREFVAQAEEIDQLADLVEASVEVEIRS